MFQHISLSPDVLPPVAPYSHAVRAGDFLFVTGQLAEDATGSVGGKTIEEETIQVMENLKKVLTEAGSSFDRIAMARIFVTDFDFYQPVNQIYASYFQPDKLPGRTTIGVTALAGEGKVEIDLIAYCGD
ncbi:MAG: RidA family protein [Leptolyngbyaceae bacterium]|nr:RidA family protein [Leptolyngbyaceae bacterium]